jgi:Tfp pilus assembly protein PilF
MPKVDPYSLIATPSDRTAPVLDQAREVFQRALPKAAQAGVITSVTSLVAFGVMAFLNCADSSAAAALAGQMGLGAVTNLLTGWLSSGNRGSMEELESAIKRALAEDPQGVAALASTVEGWIDRNADLGADVSAMATQLGRVAYGLQKLDCKVTTNQAHLVKLLTKLLGIVKPPHKRIFYGVPGQPDHFVGRDEVLADVVDLLTSGAHRKVAVEGGGGTGKSALAASVAWSARIAAAFEDGVLWAGVGQRPDVDVIYAEWARELGTDVTNAPNPLARLSAAAAGRRLLVVLDDVWEKEHAEMLTLATQGVVHLLTARKRFTATQYAPGAHRHLAAIDDEELKFRILRAYALDACAASEEQARAVAASTDGLPITLATIGAYLAQPERSLFAEDATDSLASIADSRQRLAEAAQRLGDHRTLTLADALAMSLSEFDDEQRSAFYSLGAFAHRPARFDRDAALAVAGCPSKTLALFIDRNLVEDEEAVFPLAPYALHQSMADLARTQQPAEAHDRLRAHYLGWLEANKMAWERIEAQLPQIDAIWAALPDDSPQLARYYGWLATYLDQRALYARHTAWATRTLASARALADRSAEAMALGNLGTVARNQGDYDAARTYLQQSHELHTDLGNPSGRAANLGNLGLVAMDQGDYDAARTYHQQALEIDIKLGNPLGQAQDLGGLALVEEEVGNHALACDYTQRSAAFYRRIGLAVHPAVLGLINRLGCSEAEGDSEPLTIDE